MAQARIPAPELSPPSTAPFSVWVLPACCKLLRVFWLFSPADCCCIVLSALALRLVHGLVSAALPSLCLPFVLAEAAVAGGISFFAPYVTCY